jgi:hypothetical protein
LAGPYHTREGILYFWWAKYYGYPSSKRYMGPDLSSSSNNIIPSAQKYYYCPSV